MTIHIQIANFRRWGKRVRRIIEPDLQHWAISYRLSYISFNIPEKCPHKTHTHIYNPHNHTKEAGQEHKIVVDVETFEGSY